MNEKETNKEEIQVLDPTIMPFIIPECCREHWASCPHVVRKERKSKKNVGL